MMTGKFENAAPRDSVLRVHAQVIFMRLLVATSFPVGAAITYGLDPALLTFLRFGLASVLFAPIIALRYGMAFPTPRALAGYAAISACLVTFFWSMFEALRLTTTLNMAVLFTFVPAITAFYAGVLVRERLGKHRLVALAFGFVGALWVIFRGDPDHLLSLALNRGDLIFFAGCLAMGFYTPLVKRFHGGEPPAVMTFWVLTTGTVWLFLVNNAAIWTTDWRVVDASVFAGIAYLAVFTTMISFFLQQHATLHLGPTKVTSYTYLNPTLVVLIEWVVGKGLPPLITVPGILVILAATLVMQSGSGRDRELGPTIT